MFLDSFKQNEKAPIKDRGPDEQIFREIQKTNWKDPVWNHVKANQDREPIPSKTALKLFLILPETVRQFRCMLSLFSSGSCECVNADSSEDSTPSSEDLSGKFMSTEYAFGDQAKRILAWSFK